MAAFTSGMQPLISIITPTWNTKCTWFLDLAISVLRQTTLEWEWCIVDDGSTDRTFHELVDELEALPNVTVCKLPQQVGISEATNQGLQLATAPFACCVDHDDLLTADALACTLDKLADGFDAVYSDSDKIDEQGQRSEPFHKPDWSPEFFRGVMYVGHLLTFQRELAIAIGGFNTQFDGVQDYEFFLRFSEQSSKIGHVNRILYHWRTVRGSVASDSDAKGNIDRLQQKAVQAQLERLQKNATALRGAYPHRIQIAPLQRNDWPRISIVIPTKDAAELLSKCLYSLFSKTTYPNFEVVCVDSGTTDPAALEEMRIAPVTRVLFPEPFNFSKANNLGKSFTSGDYLVFLNNDIEILSPDWLQEMLFYAEQEEIGAVGALLLYPNRLVQHAGVVLGCRGTADHVLRNFPEGSDGYAGSLSCCREVSAVTAACLMTRRRLFEQVGCFNEHFFTAYQDVDLCLKIRNLGKRIIFTPRAKLIHHESVSRGRSYDFVDRNLLLDYWEPLIKAGDPYYNPNFDVQACDYSLFG